MLSGSRRRASTSPSPEVRQAPKPVGEPETLRVDGKEDGNGVAKFLLNRLTAQFKSSGPVPKAGHVNPFGREGTTSMTMSPRGSSASARAARASRGLSRLCAIISRTMGVHNSFLSGSQRRPASSPSCISGSGTWCTSSRLSSSCVPSWHTLAEEAGSLSKASRQSMQSHPLQVRFCDAGLTSSHFNV